MCLDGDRRDGRLATDWRFSSTSRHGWTSLKYSIRSGTIIRSTLASMLCSMLYCSKPALVDRFWRNVQHPTSKICAGNGLRRKWKSVGEINYLKKEMFIRRVMYLWIYMTSCVRIRTFFSFFSHSYSWKCVAEIYGDFTSIRFRFLSSGQFLALRSDHHSSGKWNICSTLWIDGFAVKHHIKHLDVHMTAAS